MNGNLFALFRSRFPADRSQAFLEREDGRIVTYGDLEAESGRMAALLQAKGLKPGDRVAVVVEKSPEALSLYLATLQVGGVYLPLNTAYQEAEIEYFLGDAEPRVVVCDPSREAQCQALAAKLSTCHVLTLSASGDGSLMQESAGHGPLDQVAEVRPEDLAALLYTSGTTGRSKGAMMSHENLASNALALHRLWGFQADDVLLHALPIFHTHGLFVATNCVLLNGSSMIFLPRFDAEQVCQLLPRATVMMGVPTFYTRLLAHEGFEPEVCRTMRLFISGSAPLLEETFTAFEARSGHVILERYGMTETGMNTSNPLNGERRAGTVGFALPDVSVRVADQDGQALAAGEVGTLEVKGPNVFQGYWRQPEKTAAEFRSDGFFITGDLSRIDQEGYVHIVGRAKDLIISGGFNVYPKEVELVVDGLPGVSESAVIGLPHPDFGEAVCAVVVAAAGTTPSEAEVIAGVKDQLANFKVPKAVFVLETLPRNAMGKVQKAELRKHFGGHFQSSGDNAA